MNPESTPKCIGIILDGNRRWAKAKGLPTLEGHRRGEDKVKDIMRWAKEAGVSHVVVYAFSTENWNRSPEEVSYLMGLFKRALTVQLEELKKEGFRVRCIGERERFSPELQKLMNSAERDTQDLPGPTLVLALSYGGRAEILTAARRVAKEGKSEVTEQEFSSYLWSAGIPDPDLIIRTGGEKRLSGFLTWQSVYSELFFVDTFLPDFSKEEFQGIVTEFAQRERRMGR
ncbi:MAG: di-trans,poly-cis-decaprenylcistransferase [Candidatus Taylorbacteria bacterium]|nr:di-trans,poly-cis-decaprenylcistransferase [Candidatus Taylorbacteria bacterium]